MLRVSDATALQASALAASAGSTTSELIDRALDEYERAHLWQHAHEGLAERSGVGLEDHDVFAPALQDGLGHG